MKIDLTKLNTTSLLQLKDDLNIEIANRTRTFTIDELRTTIEVALGIKEGLVLSEMRSYRLKTARKLLVTLAYSFGTLSGEVITARKLGRYLNLNHSSIVRLKNKYNNIEKYLAEFKEAGEYVSEILNQRFKKKKP